MNFIKKIAPGLIICTLIAQLGLFFGKFIPSIGGAPLAIFIGLLAGNTFAKSKIFAPGSKFSESDLLSYSIVLLGGTLSFNTILQLGFSGIIFIILQMGLTITLAMFIGKKLGFSKHFSALMASGNAVCGSSAIGATSPVIKANDNDKGISITIVNLTGTLLMFALLPVANYLYSYNTLKTSALLGGILQSVGQVIAAGSMVNHNVLEISTIFKIVRIVFLVIVVIWCSKEFKNNDLKKNTQIALQKEGYSKNKKSLSIPWYIIGFFILCAFFSFGLIPESFSKVFKLISSKFEIIALAGIGMRINISELIKQGPKASLYGIFVGISQIVIAVILIKIFL
ncbi:YeiH family protein [Cetobacterium sp.]|uniref:YeiH family protein n=1 Tax=Cetobacterium sp. TaxID=2071632 RepID=UPI003F3D41F1